VFNPPAQKAASTTPHLERGMGLWGAASTNMLNMVGVGPFITIPLALAAMGGPQAMLAWIAGALISVCDGMVWAELGAAMPDSGGPYYYLLEAFGPRSWGRLFSFVFLWQAIAVGPITIASGAVGFAEYTSFLVPALHGWEKIAVAVVVCLVNTALVYRDIKSISILSVTLWVVVMATAGWILLGGFTHFRPALAFTFPPNAFHFSHAFFVGFGAATLISLYDYSGYFNVCLIGEEVREPARTIPRAILLSIAVVAALYLAMNISIVGVMPWQQAVASKTVVADFIQGIYGSRAGQIVAVLVLWAAFGSVFALLLGYSRIPYGAAVDGRFFSVFGRLHPRKHFPVFSVVVMGLLSAAACLLSLADLINYMIVFQIISQFIAQCVAVFLIRRNRPDIKRPFSMPLYPLPVVVALLGWIYILTASETKYIIGASLLTLLGVLAYLWRARKEAAWPFRNAALS
jgi:amino acid transporter